MTTALERFTQKAREEPGTRFNALMGKVFDPQGLRESCERQDGSKAPGVDGVRKEDYAQGLEARLEELSARIRRMGYRPKPVRRTFIPKGDGRHRPLGVPSFEDRLVQDRLSRILQAIWEPEFRDCSYGFRPGRSAHDALRRVAEVITNGGAQCLPGGEALAYSPTRSIGTLDTGADCWRLARGRQSAWRRSESAGFGFSARQNNRRSVCRPRTRSRLPASIPAGNPQLRSWRRGGDW